MLFAPIYIAMTFIRNWRIRSFRAQLLQFLNSDTSVAFCKVPENAAETPTLSSKLCTDPKNAYLCDLLDYTNTTRICSMKPNQHIDLTDWVACTGGLPLGYEDTQYTFDLDIGVLLECEMEPNELCSIYDVVPVESIGWPVAWKAGTHLAIVLQSSVELLSTAGYQFVCGEFITMQKLPVVRIQSVKLSGQPNQATDPSMRSLRNDAQKNLKSPLSLQWPIHSSILRKLSRVVDIKSGNVTQNGNTNGAGDIVKKPVMLTDVSVNTTKSLEDDSIQETSKSEIVTIDADNIVVENVTVEIQHNITPKKSSLTLDLKRGTGHLSSSLLNISSQIKSVTTHKKVISHTKRDLEKESSSQAATPKRPLINTKSPNVLIYSESANAKDNLEASLRKVLDCDRYTIYSVSRESLESGAWRGRVSLLAIAGSVGRAAPLLLAHLLDGGKLLALCSDLLHTVLPYYKTAEVRENEVVQFTYDKWKSVKMKHHIFCYQASPAKKQFSTENDRQPSKYTGHPGHQLDIQILASEETWRTPSLLQATDTTNKGIAIFSQIHLEADPNDYIEDEAMETDIARLEIIHKILGDILGLHVKDPHQETEVKYTRGFFLGNHVDKLSLVDKLSTLQDNTKIQTLDNMTIQYCLWNDRSKQEPSAHFLPVYVYECPEHFSTVEYFDNLTSHKIGRLVLYSEVLDSTQKIATSAAFGHGVAIVSGAQVSGRGRGGNHWISMRGQAIITVQLIMRMCPSVTLVQHAAALAAVRAIRTKPGYEELDIRIKWPNDIYYGREVKIGGNLTTACCYGDEIVVNTGTGVNISNSKPTICLNDIILEYNKTNEKSLSNLSIEMFLARYCSELERLLMFLENDRRDSMFSEYYKYWMHDNEPIRILQEGDDTPIQGTISGLDESGWLQVTTNDGVVTVAPDGNTFDIMSGLIAPKR